MWFISPILSAVEGFVVATDPFAASRARKTLGEPLAFALLATHMEGARQHAKFGGHRQKPQPTRSPWFPAAMTTSPTLSAPVRESRFPRREIIVAGSSHDHPPTHDRVRRHLAQRSKPSE